MQPIVDWDSERWTVVNRDKVRQAPGGDGVGAGVAQQLVTAGEIWEIVAIFASFHMSGVAAARTCELEISSYLTWPNDVRGGVYANEIVDLAIVLNANEDGFIWMNGRNFVTLDTAGVVADTAAAESLFPLFLVGGFSIEADITANADADDMMGIDVLYRRVD